MYVLAIFLIGLFISSVQSVDSNNSTCLPVTMAFYKLHREAGHCKFMYHNADCSIVIKNSCITDIRTQDTFYIIKETCELCQHVNIPKTDEPLQNMYLVLFIIGVFIAFMIALLNICGLQVSTRNNNTIISVPRFTMVMVIHDPRKIHEMMLSVENVTSDQKCCICLDDIHEPCSFNKEKFPQACTCSSVYCKECLFKWLTISRKCPICRISVV